MMLREDTPSCLSIVVEPYHISEKTALELRAYGYGNKTVPGVMPRQGERLVSKLREAIQAKPGVMEEPSFRMKVRIFAAAELSQYLVNLVGSEVAGGSNFMPIRLDADRLKTEAQAIRELAFVPVLTQVALTTTPIPSDLLELVYLFRPSEAISAFRLPTERISVSREKTYRTYHAPITSLPRDGLLIGQGTHPSLRKPIDIRVRSTDRRRHMYVVGKTGTGKSMMLLNMLIQDIEAGQGLCLIDPHGDLVDAVLAHVPDHRVDDVYVFDPSDREFVTGMNFLETTTGTEEERDYVTQELISILLRTVDYDIQMYGPRAQQWTRFACMTLMSLPPDRADLGGTILEIPRLFSDPGYLKRVVPTIEDEVLKQYWTQEYANISDFHKSEMMGYFTSKLTPLISGPQVRNVVGQRTSGFDFSDVMDNKRILLVNLASGKIGRRNSELLGSIFVSRLLWTAIARAWVAQENRTDFYLYVDEFQNFITDSFETILSEARKYGLNLIIAHQHLGQLTAMGRMGNKLERAVFGNAGTMVCFRTGPDAITFTSELGEPTDPATLHNLENRFAVTKLLVNETPSVAFTMKTIDYVAPDVAAVERGREIRAKALARHARPRADVEAEIRARYVE
ncbi:MAG: type IV secretory system conjugative DNA transfer family protein [Pseudonocardiaceae bacterium]